MKMARFSDADTMFDMIYHDEGLKNVFDITEDDFNILYDMKTKESKITAKQFRYFYALKVNNERQKLKRFLLLLGFSPRITREQAINQFDCDPVTVN